MTSVIEKNVASQLCFGLSPMQDWIHGKVSLILLTHSVVLGAKQPLLPQEVCIQHPIMGTRSVNINRGWSGLISIINKEPATRTVMLQTLSGKALLPKRFTQGNRIISCFLPWGYVAFGRCMLLRFLWSPFPLAWRVCSCPPPLRGCWIIWPISPTRVWSVVERIA